MGESLASRKSCHSNSSLLAEGTAATGSPSPAGSAAADTHGPQFALLSPDLCVLQPVPGAERDPRCLREQAGCGDGGRPARGERVRGGYDSGPADQREGGGKGSSLGVCRFAVLVSKVTWQKARGLGAQQGCFGNDGDVGKGGIAANGCASWGVTCHSLSGSQAAVSPERSPPPEFL